MSELRTKMTLGHSVMASSRILRRPVPIAPVEAQGCQNARDNLPTATLLARYHLSHA